MLHRPIKLALRATCVKAERRPKFYPAIDQGTGLPVLVFRDPPCATTEEATAWAQNRINEADAAITAADLRPQWDVVRLEDI